MTTRTSTILCAAAAISAAATAAGAANLKPIDPPALRAAVEAVAAELLVPGAMVLLRTPEGELRLWLRLDRARRRDGPDRGDAFPDRLEHQTMTAAVTLLLAEEGRLGLDDPVSKHVEGVPDGDAITIANLLMMRSGLPEVTDAPAFLAVLDSDPGRVWTPEELLAIAFERPMLSLPDRSSTTATPTTSRSG